MAFPSPAADYRNFRLSKLNQKEYRHVWLLLFWPIYVTRYILIETLNPAAQYIPVHCALDDAIPFCEAFVIPYVLWYVFITGMHLYTLLYDIQSFKRYSKFLIVSISISTLIFLIFPTCQHLRPAEFPQDNLLTRIVGLIYTLDTTTNVFPSEHVIGSIAVAAAAAHTESLRPPGKRAVITAAAVLICLSTVFLKQHSVLDTLAALPVCAVAYWITYGKKREKQEA